MSSLRALAVIVCVVLSVPAAWAGTLSHYAAGPGLPNVDDFFFPPAESGELLYLQYNMYYGSDTFRDADGVEIDSITTPGLGGRPVTRDLDVDLDSFSLVPGILWAPGWEVFGAKYAAVALLPIGNPSIAASLETRVGMGLGIEESSWGVGDLYVRPIWLEWNFDRVDLAASYGFYAPTGKYDVGAADNVGLGFWGHELIGSGRWHIDEARTFAAVAAVVGEINHDQEGRDLRPGAHVTVNWGLRKIMCDGWFQLGIVGYDTFQVADDSGPDAGPPSDRVKDSVHAAGIQIGVPKLGLQLKYLREFRAEDRFEGGMFTLLFALPLDPVVDAAVRLF